MNIISSLKGLEENKEMHLARLLVLLTSFSGKSGIKKIDGLTKLVKLDFLLRYPLYLERALEHIGESSTIAEVRDCERKSIESGMIRYRYGPWDPSYHLFINLLVGKGLCEVSLRGRTILVGLTPKGRGVASRLLADENFEDIAHRSHLLKTYFDISGTKLKTFIYDAFPEIVTLRLGEEIIHEY